MFKEDPHEKAIRIDLFSLICAGTVFLEYEMLLLFGAADP
jgi:hypothetical protein